MADTLSATPTGPALRGGPGAAMARPRAIGPALRMRALAAVGALLVLAILGLTYFVIMEVRAREVSDAERDLSRLDLVLAEQTDRTIQAVDLILQGVTEDLRAAGIGTQDAYRRQATGPELFRALKARVSGVPQLDAVTLIAADGTLLNFSRYYPIPHVNVADRDYFRALSAAGAPDTFLSDAVENRGTGTLNIYLARRFSGPEGQFLGLVLGALQVGYFQHFYDELRITPGTAITLRRKDGALLAARGGNPAMTAPLPPEGATVIAATGGRPAHIVAARMLQDYPVMVEVSQTLDEALAEWRHDAGAIAIGGVASAAAIAVMIWALFRQLRAYEAVTGAMAARDAAEQRRREAEEQLNQAQKMEAVGQLTAGLAHDFNNLLMAIMGCLDAIGSPPGDELGRRLGVIRQAAERGSTLTHQLLAFSRKQMLQPRALDINAVLQNTSELLQGTLGGTVRVSLRLRPDLWPALVDPGQLGHAVLNLAINARDAMPGGGFVTIETENVTLSAEQCPEGMVPGEYVRIAVIDSGTGMDPEVRSRAFDPFFTTKRHGSGSGLGLSQAYGFARQSGGGIAIQSQRGEGTTVTLWLPRAGAESAELPERAAEAGPLVPDEFTPGAARIMLVDDDTSVRETIAAILEQHGLEVLQAPDGPAALMQMETAGTIDLLVADYGMPVMNGVELARHFRARQQGIPVIIITGYADAGPLGDERYLLQKPFRAPELMAMIRTALWRAQAG